jgi:hypothetical protein
MILRNVVIYLQIHTALQPRRSTLTMYLVLRINNYVDGFVRIETEGTEGTRKG